MPPVYYPLEYTPESLGDLFTVVAHQPWAMLLDSGFAEHSDNRFDIMVADPVATLTTCGGLTCVVRDGLVTESEQDPLVLLHQTLQESNLQAAESSDYPFQGGALGLFGYDLGRRFEKLPQRAKPDLTTPDMAVGIYDWALIADHHRQTLTLITHGDAAQRLRWLDEQTPQVPEPFRLTSAWASNMSREAYGEKFRQVQAWLRSGDCY